MKTSAKMKTTKSKMWLLFLAMLIKQASACLNSKALYGDEANSPITFDDYDNLNSNFRQGMEVDNIQVCSQTLGGKLYLVGIQVNLQSPTLTGEFQGLNTGTCETKNIGATVTEVKVGRRSNYNDTSKQSISYLRFTDDFGQVVDFGSSSQSTGGKKTWSFDSEAGGFIGVYGTYSEMINEIGPYYSPGLCTCSQTELISQSVQDMAISLSSGVSSLQTIPIFADTHQQQGRGGCGTQSYTITQSDGSSCANFLTVSNDELVLASSDTSLKGQYSIRLTVTMDDYTTIQTTTDFIVTLVVLDSDSSYVASKMLTVGEGPYTVANTCFTEPNLGYTLVLGMTTSTSSLPSYANYDSSSVSITADPQSNDLDGDTFSITYFCYIDQLQSQLSNYQETVIFSVESGCPDEFNLDCPICPDPSDATDTTCPTFGCPDASNLNCPICPDETDLTDTTCPKYGCPDASNLNCDICPNETDLTDTTCPKYGCPDENNLNCDICPDETDLTDTTCPKYGCPDEFNLNCDLCPDDTDLTDTTCPKYGCPDEFNLNCDICPDDTDLTDTTCPKYGCPDEFNLNCDICPDDTDPTDTTCPFYGCPDESNPNCPSNCPDPFDFSDITCPTYGCPNINNPNCPICSDPSDFTDTTCTSTEPTDISNCPDIDNLDCPICPDSTDLTDTTCPNFQPQPACHSSVFLESFENEDAYDVQLENRFGDTQDTLEPNFTDLRNHKYYVPSGSGPVLSNFFSSNPFSTQILVTEVGKAFSYKFKFYNEDPVDDCFKDYWGSSEIHVLASIYCNEVSFFADCQIDENDQHIYISSNGIQDPEAFGLTYSIKVILENEILQKNVYRIDIIAVKPEDLDTDESYNEGEDEPSTDPVQIEDLDLIESIVIDTAAADLKGKLIIEFSELIYTNSTEERRRQLQQDDLNITDDILQLQLRIENSKNGLDEDVIAFTYDVQELSNEKIEIQLDFDCPECISSYEVDYMTVVGIHGDKVLFTQDVELPPQVDKDYFLTEYIEFAAYITIFVLSGTIAMAILLDLIFFHRFQYKALWQAVEVWQQVYFIQIFGVPIPGYTLLYTPKLMPVVNFDIFHFLEKYWRDVPLFNYVQNEHRLGINLVTFGFDSVHFLDNTRSVLGLTGVLLLIFLLGSWRITKESSREYMLDAVMVLAKTITYYTFIISATIQLRYNGDDGMQTALAILTQCFLGLAIPIYFMVKGCKQKKCPTRQNLTLVLRALTCVAVIWGAEYPEYQFIFLMTIHIVFIYFCAYRFNKYATMRSIGLAYSYGLLPILILSLRLDESGISPVALTMLILLFSTVYHVWISDWAYQVYLYKMKRKNLAIHQGVLDSRKKRQEQIKKNRQALKLENEANNDGEDNSQEGLELETEVHDFRMTEDRNLMDMNQNDDISQIHDGKLIRPLALTGMNKNKVVPIMEVPSSDSERSSMKEKYVQNVNSVVSQDSYGFQPKVFTRTTSMNGGAILTGAALAMVTTEADDKGLTDLESNRNQHGQRDSMNFSNGAGKISSIEFFADGKRINGPDNISFASGEAKNLQNSNFKEELLNSSASRSQPSQRVDGIPSQEFILKPSTIKDSSIFQKDLEINIDIDWPAERVESEYRKQQNQKMQLMFGPNWEYKGEEFDIDKNKKEVFLWKRNENQRRSMVLAQEPNIQDPIVLNDGQQRQKNPAISAWVQETKKKQQMQQQKNWSPKSSLGKNSMVQSIIRMNEYSSVPNPYESLTSNKDPFFKVPKGGHNRINSASLDFYLSNTDNMPEEQKNKFQEEEKLESVMDAREIQLFSRHKKERKQKGEENQKSNQEAADRTGVNNYKSGQSKWRSHGK